MGLPSKQRTSRSKKERAAHAAIVPTNTTACGNCGVAILPHHACPKCGMYRGRQVLNVKKRMDRAVEKAKRKT